ncbi:hypothetical protein Avbf_06547 [Armadillidium vulgare]|nr:hypothetical protein Avbf_06547 [Armadillidium vulgare]
MKIYSMLKTRVITCQDSMFVDVI